MLTGRTIGFTEYHYVYNGGQLMQEVITTETTADGETTTTTETLNFTYDAAGTPLSVTCDNATYYYVTNIQGDVLAIVNTSGTTVVQYTYDAWGNILSTSGSLSDTLRKTNPLRYRGYVYDQDTGLYYLQSRYYDPEMGRFINADHTAYLGIDGTLLTYNLFTYCKNNPVMLLDFYGNAPDWWQWTISGAMMAVGIALIATGVGGIAGGALVCAGANSIIGSYISEATGSSSVGGWVGGLITGGFCGTGAGLAGNQLIQATQATGGMCFGKIATGGLIAFSSGTVGSVIGQNVSAAIDGRKADKREVALSAMTTGSINCISGIGAGIGTAL